MVLSKAPRLPRKRLHELKASLERIQGVRKVRHHEDGHWTVDVRSYDKRATANEIAYRVTGVRLDGIVTVGTVTELVGTDRQERVFRVVVSIREDIGKATPSEAGLQPGGRGGDRPPVEGAR